MLLPEVLGGNGIWLALPVSAVLPLLTILVVCGLFRIQSASNTARQP